MMFYAGCDVGSRTVKAVILDQNSIRSAVVMDTGPRPEVTVEAVLDAAATKAGIDVKEILRIVGTGYGKRRIPFAHAIESEISCHGRAVSWCNPTARGVIDIGGQDSKAMNLDDRGNVIRYMYNDKCASGTGRFLEIMAEALEIPVSALGRTGASARNPCTLSSQCVIFAETEVISLVNAGHSVADVVAGLHRALAARVAALARGIGIQAPVVMTGGVAHNPGVFSALAEALGLPLEPIQGLDPQIAGALGAALMAREKGAQTSERPVSG
jgi:predicted CoA-substrate-specific enzyme activase